MAYGKIKFASADGLYAGKQVPHNFHGARFKGTYRKIPVGTSAGVSPALFGVFFNPAYRSVPQNSADYRSTSGITPDPRAYLSYAPAENQPFCIGDGYTGNNAFKTASDSLIPSGTMQTFNIPTGATQLLLGIGQDPRLAAQHRASGAFKVHVYDNSPGVVVDAMANDPAPGLPGYWLASVGAPSSDLDGNYAFMGKLKNHKGKAAGAGIWFDNGVQKALLVRTGSLAPGTNRAVFNALSDPDLANNDAVVFGATLQPHVGDASASNNTGIWAVDGTGGDPTLVVRAGSQPAEVQQGVRFASFSQFFGVTGHVVYVGRLVHSNLLGVSAANDHGVWVAARVGSSYSSGLLVRTGDEMFVEGLTKTVKAIASISCSTSRVNCQLKFTDGTEALEVFDFPTIPYAK